MYEGQALSMKFIVLAIAIVLSGSKLMAQKTEVQGNPTEISAAAIKILTQQDFSVPGAITSADPYRHYLRTHKTLKTLGWVSLAAGPPVVLLGIAVAAGSIEGPASNARTGAWIALSGLTLTFSSIPLFIISHHYKKKAISVLLSNQQVFTPDGSGMVPGLQRALRITIEF